MRSGRWQSQLPPDLQRAAPEIYRNLRTQGAASTREWVDRNFHGDRTGGTWIDMWNLASEVDFELDQEASDAAIFQRLATSDGLEIRLRRLASFLYEARTHDRTGALQMLAIAPPGAQVDLAPTWLVTQATNHSRNEYQRAERVAAGRRGGRGGRHDYDGGRQPGRGGRGRGGQTYDEHGTVAAEEPKGEGRGGKGGRRGGRGRGRK